MSENPQQAKTSIGQEELEKLLEEPGALGEEFLNQTIAPTDKKLIDVEALQKKIDEAGPTQPLLDQTEIDKLFLGEN